MCNVATARMADISVPAVLQEEGVVGRVSTMNAMPEALEMKTFGLDMIPA